MPTAPRRTALFAAVLLAGSALVAGADVSVTVAHHPADQASPTFDFPDVPRVPQRGVARALISVVDGKPDDGARPAIYLGKSKLPASEDDPKSSFFFAEGTDGGRLRIDLESAVPVRRLNTYSWHPSSRAPQVYTLYAADGTGSGFNPAPPKGTDPTSCGWTRVAAVDTRTKFAGDGGQYAVSIAADAGGPIGTYRYLLLDVSKTEDADGYGNTFFSKIDVVADRPATTRPATLP